MLKPISKGINSLDQEILKQYQNISESYKDSGKNSDSIAFWLGTISNPLIAISHRYFGSNVADLIEYAFVPDRAENIFRLINFPKNEVNTFIENINKNIRLATFISGAAMMSKAGYEIMQYYTNTETSLDSGIDAILIGTGLLLRASSMYLKNDSLRK